MSFSNRMAYLLSTTPATNVTDIIYEHEREKPYFRPHFRKLLKGEYARQGGRRHVRLGEEDTNTEIRK